MDLEVVVILREGGERKRNRALASVLRAPIARWLGLEQDCVRNSGVSFPGILYGWQKPNSLSITTCLAGSALARNWNLDLDLEVNILAGM